MSESIAQLVRLLQPRASSSKRVLASGPWYVRHGAEPHPFYFSVLDGSCRLSVRGREPLTLKKGDFVFLPAACEFATSSDEPQHDGIAASPVQVSPGVFRLGGPAAPPSVRMLVGRCLFGSNDAVLLAACLPSVLHVRGEGRLTALLQLIDDEARSNRPGRDFVLARLLEVVLVEALRCGGGAHTRPGLLKGLADRRLASALHLIHGQPHKAWTVGAFARAAALSRSAFFERFKEEVGVAPMTYLLSYRMALAKVLLARPNARVADVAARVGYTSASTFTVAFSRHIGLPPASYARQLGAVLTPVIQ